MRKVSAVSNIPKSGTADYSNTLVGKAFEKIREDIIASKLQPGEKLRIAHLRKQYGIGASPLREALSRLVAEGLGTSEGQRGFWVPPVSREEYADIVKTRIVLETYALRESILHGDDEWEGRIAGTYHNLSRVERRLTCDPETFFPDWWERNRQFHDALVAACPLQWLLRFDRIVFDLHNRYNRFALRRPNFSPELFEDHRLITQAALDRNADRAVALLEAHIVRPPAPDFDHPIGREASGA